MNATLTPLARTVTSGYSAASVCGKRAVYDLKYLLLNPKKELKTFFKLKKIAADFKLLQKTHKNILSHLVKINSTNIAVIYIFVFGSRVFFALKEYNLSAYAFSKY